MHALPTQLVPAVPHVTFWVFDLALPNLVAWALVDVAAVVAAFLRLPRWLEPRDEAPAPAAIGAARPSPHGDRP